MSGMSGSGGVNPSMGGGHPCGLPHCPTPPSGLGGLRSPAWKFRQECKSPSLLVWAMWALHNSQPVCRHIIYSPLTNESFLHLYSGNLFRIHGLCSYLFIYLFIYLNSKIIFSIKTFIGTVENFDFAMKKQIINPAPSLVCCPALVSFNPWKLRSFKSQCWKNEQFESRPQSAPVSLYRFMDVRT